MRELIFDTETTGLSPAEGHKIIEVGFVELINRVPTGATFQRYINPERDVSAESTRITGITNERVAGEPTFKEILPELVAFIGDSPLVAHNASFDMGFMHAEFTQAGAPKLQNEVIDTLKLARKKHPGGRHTLDALCKRFNITAHEKRDVHGALLDAELLAEVYIELTGGLQEALILENTTQTTTAQTVQTASLTRAPLIIQPTETELANANAWRNKLSS